MDIPRTTRRSLLAAGAAASAAASAGCAGVLDGATDGNDGGDDNRLRLTLSRLEGSLRDRYVEDLSSADPPWSEAAFEAARAGEAYTTQGREPFYSSPSDPTYARRDGTYYRLGSVVVDEVATTHPVLRLYEADGGEGAVAADALPEADLRAVKAAYMAARARGNAGGVPWGMVQRGGYVYRREDAVADSQLLGDDGPTHVRYRDTRYRVAVSRERFHEPVYRATVEPVADSPERLEAALRAKFVEARFGRADLSADARDVLREARTEGYVEAHPYSDAYEAVLVAMHARPYLDGNIRKDALPDDLRADYVLYDGTYFDHRLAVLDGE